MDEDIVNLPCSAMIASIYSEFSGAGRALFNDRPGFPKDGRFSKAHPSWIRGALRTRVNVEKSSGNVFADIGFANPEREQLKAHLTLHIYRIIKSRGLT